MEINRTTLGIAAGVAGSLFLGYCLYFDFKRRKDPEYKKKVHDRMYSFTVFFIQFSFVETNGRKRFRIQFV